MKSLQEKQISLGYKTDTIAQRTFLVKAIRRRIETHVNNLIKVLAKEFRRQEPEVKRKIRALNIKNAKRRKTPIEFFNMKLWIKRIADASRHDIFLATQDGYVAGSKPLKGYGYLTDLTLEQKADVAGAVGFTEGNAHIQEWLDNYTIQFSTNINQTIQKDLNKIVKRGIEIGGGTETVREYIQDKANLKYEYLHGTKELLPWQARRMALTATAGAQNSGHVASLVDSKVVKYKAWISARNGKVRDSHKTADKRYTRKNGIPLQQNFQIGSAFVSSPGNLVSGDISEIMNCHCVVVGARKGKKVTGKPKKIQSAIDEEVPLPTIKPKKTFTTGKRKLTF